MHGIPVRLFLVSLTFLGAVLALPAADTDLPVFRARSTTGNGSGPLLELADGWAVRLGGEPAFRAASGELVALARAGTPLPSPPAEEQLLLTGGDRLPGHVLKLAGERLHFQPDLAGAPEMVLPLSAVSVLWLKPLDGAVRPEVMRRELASGRRKHDAVLLCNGDVLEGILSVFEGTTVKLEVDRKLVAIERGRVAAIALSTELGSGPRPKGPYGRLVLTDGCRLSLASAVCTDGRTLTGKTLFGATVSIPLADIAALYVFQGPAVYLSDLKPRRYEYTPYLGTENYPLVTDASVAGRPLRLAGAVYDKGLGTHSACRVTYDLADAYRQLEALVGLDEDTGAGGAVRLQVLVDGKPRDLGRAADLTVRAGAVPLRLDVAGARELILVVEFGPGGNVCDHVDWADARLLK